MKLLRTMSMTAGLLLFAQAGFAQTVTTVTLQTRPDGEPRQTCPSGSCQQLSECAGACPLFGENSWVNQMLRQSVANWQRLNAVCGRGDASCNGFAIAIGTAAKGSCTSSPGCAKGGDAVAAQKCCCVKECACCESCSAPKIIAVPKQVYGFRVETCPLVPGMGCPMTGFPPFPPPWMPMSQPAQTWVAPMPGFMPNARVIAVQPGGPPTATATTMPMPPMPFQMVRSAPVANTPTQQAHLVTADFDVRCERMTHRGDMVLLEGNVRLVCLKQGRHMLVEANRVTLNLREGTFTVEPNARPTQSTLLRTTLEVAR